MNIISIMMQLINSEKSSILRTLGKNVISVLWRKKHNYSKAQNNFIVIIKKEVSSYKYICKQLFIIQG